MSVKTVSTCFCDRCGAKIDGEPPYIPFFTEWQTCPAGGSGEHRTERIHLCLQCVPPVIESLQGIIGYDFINKVLEKIRNHPKRGK